MSYQNTIEKKPTSPKKSKRKKIVYLIGKMRNLPNFGFPAFDKAKELGQSLGYEVISPADIDRQEGICELTKGGIKGGTLNMSYKKAQNIIEHCATRDIQAIFRATHLAVLPNWRDSVGGTAEVALGRWLRKKFLSAITYKKIDIEKYFAKLKD